MLTYGPSRAEIERARVEGRAPGERPREGKALEDALVTMARTADAMRSLQHVAALTGLPEIGEKIARAEEALRRGGVPTFATRIKAGRSWVILKASIKRRLS